MKTQKDQKSPELRETSGSSNVAGVGGTPPDHFQAYSPGAAAMPLPSHTEKVAPTTEVIGTTREGGVHLHEADIEMNRRMHGSSSDDAETDYEEQLDEDTEDDDDFTEEDYEDDAVDALAAANERGQVAAPDLRETGQRKEVELSVKEIVWNINNIALRTVERGKREIGEYVFNVVFNGDIDAVLSRNPNKTESMRKISEDPELRVSRRQLGSLVRVAALCRELEANNVDTSNIMTAKLEALLRVKNQQKRAELAREVESEGLSLRQIVQRAGELNGEGNSRSAAQILRRKINDPLSLLADAEAMGLLEDQDRLAKLIPYKDRIEMVTLIDEVAERIEASTAFLEKARDNLYEIDAQRLQRRKK